MPDNLCNHHRGVYQTRLQALRRRFRYPGSGLQALRRRFRYPGSGRKALAREAATIARQCIWCIHRDPPPPTYDT